MRRRAAPSVWCWERSWVLTASTALGVKVAFVWHTLLLSPRAPAGDGRGGCGRVAGLGPPRDPPGTPPGTLGEVSTRGSTRCAQTCRSRQALPSL